MQHLDLRKPIILNLGFQEAQFENLKKYVRLLTEANEELNLVSRKMSFEELIDNHIIDSLLPLKQLPQNLKVIADFGTGGGFPAVLFALQNPNTLFYLYEKSPLKQSFLKQCAQIAPNLVIQGEIKAELKNVQLITARAFKPIDVILELSRDYYKKNGAYFLLKGRLEKIEEETLLAQKKFRDLSTKTIALKSPVLDVERHLVLIHELSI